MPRSSKKCQFKPWDWGRNIPLSVAYPPSRDLTNDEMYQRRLKAEMLAEKFGGAVNDPNNVPHVKEKILAEAYRSPFKGLHLPGAKDKI